MHKSDLEMAGVYGGTAEPRVRMVPKKVITSVRSKSNFRDQPSDQVSSEFQIIPVSTKQTGSNWDMRKLNMSSVVPMDPDLMSNGLESNVAKSIRPQGGRPHDMATRNLLAEQH